MALQATRALRGTKTLTRAFHEAAETIPLHRRAAVVTAALASIRDVLKAARERAKAAKAITPSTTKKPLVGKNAVRKLPKAA
jgi:hypothetical protein